MFPIFFFFKNFNFFFSFFLLFVFFSLSFFVFSFFLFSLNEINMLGLLTFVKVNSGSTRDASTQKVALSESPRSRALVEDLILKTVSSPETVAAPRGKVDRDARRVKNNTKIQREDPQGGKNGTTLWAGEEKNSDTLGGPHHGHTSQ